MKSRLGFIRALVHDPDVLFLDEPTSGLDPNNSRIMKDLILKERDNGKTIIITTHNMDDATELCDRVAFIVNGEMKALDTPHSLIMAHGASKIKYTFTGSDGKELERVSALSDISEDKTFIQKISSNSLTSVHSSEPTLSDIFMEITGYELC